MATEAPIQLSPTELLVIASMEAEAASRPRPAFTPSPPVGETVSIGRPATSLEDATSQEEEPDGKRLLAEARQLIKEEETDYQQSKLQYRAAKKILPVVQAVDRFDRSRPMEWADRKLGLAPPKQPAQTVQAVGEGLDLTIPTLEEKLEAEVQARLTEREQMLLPELEQQLRPEIEAEIRQILDKERQREAEDRRQETAEAGERTVRERRVQLIDLARRNPDALKSILGEWLAEEPEGAEPRPSTRLVAIPEDLPENVRAAFARIASLPPTQKAAILFLGLGPDLSASLLKSLPDEQVELLTLEFFKLGTVDEAIIDAIFFKAYEQATTAAGERGSAEVAKIMLEKALGQGKAAQLIEKVKAKTTAGPFSFLADADPVELINMLMPEHPQTVALVLSHLPAEQTAQVISGLPPSIQADIAQRIATMNPVPPQVLRKVEAQLKQKFAKTPTAGQLMRAGGIPHLVEILKRTDPASEKTILETMDEQNPELAEEVRKNMFVFEDIGHLTPHDMNILWRHLDQRQVALALRGASEEVKEKFMEGQSERNKQALLQEMEQLGPIRADQVYEAQDEIANEVRRLTEMENIVIPRGSEKYVVEKPPARAPEVVQLGPARENLPSSVRHVLETSRNPLADLAAAGLPHEEVQGFLHEYKRGNIERLVSEGRTRMQAEQLVNAAIAARTEGEAPPPRRGVTQRLREAATRVIPRRESSTEPPEEGEGQEANQT